MKIIFSFLLVLLLAPVVSFSQDCATIENDRIRSGIIKKGNGIDERIISKNFVIIFGGGFADSMVVYLNDKMIFRDYLKSDFSTSVTGKKITLDPKTLKAENILKIVSLTNADCMVAKIKTSYKVLYVDKYATWYLKYTNYRLWLE